MALNEEYFVCFKNIKGKCHQKINLNGQMPLNENSLENLGPILKSLETYVK